MHNLRYFIEISRKRGYLHTGDPEKPLLLENLRLSPDDVLSIKQEDVRLGELTVALVEYDEQRLDDWFDERGQYEIGVYLYRQLFGEKPPNTGDGAVDIRIVTEDENISRLPWMLLAHHGIFLSVAGWAVSLSPHARVSDCELPPSPRILVVAPQPDDWTDTEAEAHLLEFTDMLSSADMAYIGDSHLKTVNCWSDFIRQLQEFQPNILYYYGHGTGDRYATRLVFADKNNEALEKPLPDIAAELRNMEGKPPLLAYINCCQGDAGGLLGAGKQLAEIIPAVVTCRTVAMISAARAQAMAFWKAALLHGFAPHLAVAQMRGHLSGLDLSTGDVRWITPVLHCSYDDWQANPPKPPPRLERDPNWQLKLDRVSQFSQIFYQSHQMLMERKPRALAYLWYGTPEQGMEIFHRRLNTELAEKLPDMLVYEVSPEWPEDLFDPARSFNDMLCQAFEVNTPEHFSGRIRTYGKQISGQRILVYIHHRPVTSPLVFDHKNIKLYLNWWSRHFVPHLPENAHALLGISYEVRKPAKFHKFVTQTARLHELNLPDTVFELLDELDKVTKRDLLSFIKTHNIKLPEDIQEKLLEDILQKTEGSYVQILNEMRQLESRAWRESMNNAKHGSNDEEDDDMY